MRVLRDGGFSTSTVGLVLLICGANITYRVENSIKTDNLSLHKFNTDKDIAPQGLFGTAVDNCLGAGSDPEELVAILRERSQVKTGK